jgi:hypothetical protein
METHANTISNGNKVPEQTFNTGRNASWSGPQGTNSRKVAYAITERSSGKSFWTRVGVGFVNRDGSITIRLDAMPVSGTLQLRDWTPRDAGERHEGDAPPTEPFASISFGKASDAPF